MAVSRRGDPESHRQQRRPNTRRAIRSLIRRGLTEQDEEGRVKLTWWGAVKAAFLDAPEASDYEAERRRERREFEESLAAWRAEREEGRRKWFEEEDRWEKNRKGSYQRDRFPGQNQLRVLAVLRPTYRGDCRRRRLSRS